MGCDIHVFTEALESVRNQKVWCNIDNWRINKYFGDDDEPEYNISWIFSDRNYELFSFLADVRNYGHNKSFHFDRGIPEDVSSAVKNEFERWGNDAHTPGWATLKELKEAAAQVQKVSRKGFVLITEADKYRLDGTTPTEWCQGVGGPHRDKFEWLEWEDENHCFDKFISAVVKRKMDIFWQRDEAETAHDEDIRIVFWFDN